MLFIGRSYFLESQALTRVTGAPIVIAGWLVDTTAMQIKRADKIEKLDRRVMATLEYLAFRQGKVVSRQELKEVIWAGTEVGDAAIEAAILELRRAMGADAQDATIIETVSRTGYRLIGRVTYTGANGISALTNPKQLEVPIVGLSAATRSVAVDRLRANDWRLAAYLMILLMIAVTFWLQPWGSRVEPASIEAMQSPLPDKPSIAILPLVSPSEDPEQEIVVDGMTADLISRLSNLPGLYVVEPNSMFAYKNQQVEIRDVAHSHGVRYVLEGSVRRAGVRLRIDVRLIDALSGDSVWRETLDGVLADKLKLQENLSRGLVEQLAPD